MEYLDKKLDLPQCAVPSPFEKNNSNRIFSMQPSDSSSPSGTYPAANMLQSMLSLHEKVCKGQIMTPKPLPIINKEVQRQQQQARKRKPDKSSICHFIPEVILREEPEVTITPTTSKKSSLESMSGVMRVRQVKTNKLDQRVDEPLPGSQVSG